MNQNNRKTASAISLFLFVLIAAVHLVLTNVEGPYFNYTKVLLMPSLALFFFLAVRDRKRGWPILWAQAGLWLGNICLIGGEESKLLFFMGSAMTILGFLGYLYIMGRNVKKLSFSFLLLQVPIVWVCAYALFLMGDDLGSMLIPVAVYMTLICLISLSALAQLVSHPRSPGCWLMFGGSLFYIGENTLYTADHYMSSLAFGENIVHPCFIAAQTLFAIGYLLIEHRDR